MIKSLQSVDKKRIVIGRVGAPHGIHGEVKIQSLTDFIERFDDLKEVLVGEELLHVISVRHDVKVIRMKFKEYAVREEAMKLTGKLLTVDRSQAAPLAEGEYYAFDIIGLCVYHIDGTELGVVENVLRTGSNDVYVARSKVGKEILIPALKSVVKDIDIPQGRMTVDMMQEISDAH